MIKIKKYQMKAFLKIFKNMGCNTIEEIENLLDKELKKDTDVVFQFPIKHDENTFKIPLDLK